MTNEIMEAQLADKKDLQVGDYTRTIHKRGVTFSCSHCGNQVTEERYPGPIPKYCLDCVDIVRRKQARDRKRKQRRKK